MSSIFDKFIKDQETKESEANVSKKSQPLIQFKVQIWVQVPHKHIWCEMSDYFWFAVCCTGDVNLLTLYAIDCGSDREEESLSTVLNRKKKRVSGDDCTNKQYTVHVAASKMHMQLCLLNSGHLNCNEGGIE